MQKIIVRIGCGHWPQGSLAKGSWHGEAVTEGFPSRHFPKSTNLCGNLQAWGIPPVLPEAKPPPFGKGGFGRPPIPGVFSE